MKVRQFYNKNQFLIEDRGCLYLQSYDSLVAKIDNHYLTLGRDWDYSNTTRKHLYLFLDDYLFSIVGETKNKIREILSSSNNKRKDIQKLIDKKYIQYDEKL